MMPGDQRTSWTRVAFGDVVQLCKKRSSDPVGDGLERYVGLEHLEPGDLKIRSWGDVADGTTFTSVFRPGQVLFGKRRAYQRKVAVADFAGVCSGDIYILEPKNDHLLPELLPFICQTDSFFDHAVGTSAGSLSPRTNWKSLATYDLALPPMDEQRRIAEVLQAAELVKRGWQNASGQVTALQSAVLHNIFDSKWESWPKHRIDEVGSVQMGRQKSPKFTKGLCPRPYLRVGNLGAWRLNLREVAEMDFDDRELEKYRLLNGDILITEGDIVSPLNVGRSAMFKGEIPDCCFQNHLIRFRSGEGVLPEYVRAALRYMHMRRDFAKAAKITTITSLGVTRLASMTIRVPSLAEQRRIARAASQIWDLDVTLWCRIAAASSLQTQLIQEVLAA